MQYSFYDCVYTIVYHCAKGSKVIYYTYDHVISMELDLYFMIYSNTKKINVFYFVRNGIMVMLSFYKIRNSQLNYIARDFQELEW